LLKFVHSKDIYTLLGEKVHVELVNFLNQAVFVHEDYFARHNYIFIRTFRIWGNNRHEGTNNGLKYSENGVRPNMGLVESTKTLMDQDDGRWDLKAKATSDSLFKKKLRTESKTANQLSKEAEGEVQQEFQARHNYGSHRVSDCEWLVMFLGVRKQGRLIPNFERVRRVVLAGDGSLSCSCNRHEETGIPCRHIAHVMQFYTKGFNGFSIDDIDIRYHNMYAYYVAYKLPSELDEAHLRLQRKLMSSRQDPTANKPRVQQMDSLLSNIDHAIGDGINFEGSVSDHIMGANQLQPCCNNYTKEQIDIAVQEFKHQTLGQTYFEATSETVDDDADFDWAACIEDDTESMDDSPQKDVVHEVCQPSIKEMLQVFDAGSPNAAQRLRKELDYITMKEKKRQAALDFGDGGPKGKKVSGKVSSRHESSKHKRQRR